MEGRDDNDEYERVEVEGGNGEGTTSILACGEETDAYVETERRRADTIEIVAEVCVAWDNDLLTPAFIIVIEIARSVGLNPLFV